MVSFPVLLSLSLCFLLPAMLEAGSIGTGLPVSRNQPLR